MNNRVLLAMSGGVDSSIAAFLLQEQGYEVVGLTLKIWSYEKTYRGSMGSKSDHDFIEDAQQLAAKLNIEHHVVDIQNEFDDSIIQYFINEYLAGRTPNPCVICNPTMKWKTLLEQAALYHCDKVATGHYVQLKQSNGRYYISKGTDEWKDQSYVLWKLSQEALGKTLFPLGTLNKSTVKQMAAQFGLTKIVEKAESFDVCFIPDGNYRTFLQQRRPELASLLQNGIINDCTGKCLGRHKGYPFYTIGQRKGLEVAVGHPIYVTHIDPENNIITLGEKEELMSDHLVMNDFNIQKYESLPDSFRALVKIRYKDKGEMAQISRKDEQLICAFDHPVSAITAGQSAVIYEDTDLVGGGIIA